MKTFKLLAVLIVLLIITSITLSNHSLDDSEEVRKLSENVSTLEHDNTLLKDEIAEAGSLTKIAAVAAEHGFVETPKIVTLSLPSHVASAN